MPLNLTTCGFLYRNSSLLFLSFLSFPLLLSRVRTPMRNRTVMSSIITAIFRFTYMSL